MAEEIIERARLLALPARVVARVGGDTLTLKTEPALALGRSAHGARGLAAAVYGIGVAC